jgi:ABC-type branched-subunit amino acid transport system ATPase component
MENILLEINQLRKTFGNITAIESLDFHLNSGEICGIMGPNGSGKTILFDLISGIRKPDSGQIYFGDNRIDLTKTEAEFRYSLGIVRNFQQVRLVDSLNILENTLIGLGPPSFTKTLKAIIIGASRRRIESAYALSGESALKNFGQRLLPRKLDHCSSLSFANHRRLEIARALVKDPLLLLLDEPTAGMNPKETYEFQEIIYRMKKRGISILIIEHKLYFLEDLADRIIVLAQGNKIAEGTPPEIRENVLVKKVYWG